jgi:hypothetical protein
MMINAIGDLHKPKKMHKQIAYFISPHGFGHAARASAVMTALREMDPGFHFEIFTTVPKWFFEESVENGFTYHSLLTDIGLVQKTSLCANLPETVVQLDRFLPFEDRVVETSADQIIRSNASLIICDIAPLGIAVAQKAGVPSMLVENFTWDWVYDEYVETHKGLKPYMAYTGALFRRADYHVQTMPVCLPGAVDLTVPPVSRRPRTRRSETRQKLGIPENAKLLIITMGGIPEDHGFMESLSLPENLYLLIPGAGPSLKIRDHQIRLPHRSEFFHPDLITSADAVIGKVGYSTLAEIYHAGVPFGFIKRSNFRESDILAVFIEEQMSGFSIPEAGFHSGQWLTELSRLLNIRRIERKGENGAIQIARFVQNLLEKKTSSL